MKTPGGTQLVILGASPPESGGGDVELLSSVEYEKCAGHAYWRGLGQPTAARIMSLVQSAQEMYLRGSSIEIERLSPLRSWPSPLSAAVY